MKLQVIKKNNRISELRVKYRFMKPGRFLPLMLCFLVLSFSNNFAQRFSIEQTEAFINESWTSAPFELVYGLNFIDSLRGIATNSYDQFSITTDGGRTWKNKKTLSGHNRDTEIIMISPDTLIYISVNKKLVFSVDGATTWTISDSVKGVTGDISSMVFYNKLRAVCVTTDGVIRVSTDGGYNWVGNTLDSAAANLNFSIYGSYTLGFGSKETFILSTDQGSTWRTIRFSDSIYTPNFMKFMKDKIYISTASNRWYISDLDGQILLQEYLGTNSEVRRFAFPNENEIWAADRTRGVKVSVPGSGNWVASGFPQQLNIYSVNESFNGKVLVSIYDMEDGLAMMRQRNPGKNYSVRNGKLPGNYRLSTVKIINPGLTLVGSYDGIIFRSTDMGINWEATTGNNIYPAITGITFKDPSLIFAGCEGGYILKSTDGGLSWILVKTNISEKITGIEYKQVDSLFITTESKVYTTTLSNPSLLVQLNLDYPSTGRIFKVKFWNRHVGYIGAEKNSAYTINGGKTWTSYGLSYMSAKNTSRLPGIAFYHMSGSRVKYDSYTVPMYNESTFRGTFEIIDHDSTAGYIIDRYYGAFISIFPRDGGLEYFLAGGPRQLLDFDYYNADYSLGVGDSGELLFISRRSSQEPPSICYGLTPNHNTSIFGRDITFSWTEPNVLVPTDEYQIEISKGDTSNHVFSQSGIDSTSFKATGLEEEKTYFWRVRGHNAFGWGQFTGWVQFFLGREVYSFNQYQLPDSATINSITQDSTGMVWAVGNGGFIIKSSDLGISWQVVSVPFSDDLKYCTVNPWSNSIFIASSTGDLLTSSDSGNSWQRTAAILPGSIITSIVFLSEVEGYLCGTSGLIARSEDGGVSWWLSSVNGMTINLNSILGLGGGVVLIAGETGMLFKSEDFGRHFSPTQIFAGDNYKSLFRFNNKLVLLNSLGEAKTSSDNGLNWSDLNLNFNGIVSGVDVASGRFRILSNGNTLYTSTKDGTLLSGQILPGTNSKNALFLTSSGNLIVAGSGSVILVGKDTSTIYTSLAGDDLNVTPGSHQLLQNYPNPFNGSTVIPIYLKEAAAVELDIYNMLGEKVSTLFSGDMAQGRHFIPLDATNLTSGIYFYRIRVGGLILTKKLILLK